MKKKNLIILLIIPFIISLLGIVTINVTFNLIENDILGIKWDYNDVEGFKVDGKFELKASAYSNSKYPLSMGNQLTWSVKNKDASDEEVHAEIVKENDRYYLITKSSGEVIVTCSNEKGNVFKAMTAVIFSDGAIIVNPKIKSSQNNIDSTLYYGQYDLKNNAKVNAVVKYDIQTIPEDFIDEIYVKEKTSNVNFDLTTGHLSILDKGDVKVTLAHKAGRINDTIISFKAVENGVNVYTYDDLLYCTNQSEDGEIVCLRKSFESLENFNQTKDNNVELFGHYDSQSKKYNFKNEVYDFETTFNQEYISQWNEFAKTNKNYKEIDNIVYSGLHVQKDFYGNGYTINFHNLAYPYSSIPMILDDGSKMDVPTLTDENIFRGPLPFYTLGNPHGLPLITAFGQDNIGMYVEGNQILINDVNLKNCDFGNVVSNLTYAGTVLEVYGNNINIKNSRMANGKNVLRSFSSQNIIVDNCMLSNSRNFLISTGSNEYIKTDGSKVKNFTSFDGSEKESSIQDYLSAQAAGDITVTNYISGEFQDVELMRSALMDLDSALNDESQVANSYKGSMDIINTLFYQSGIASIALETYFNGPYLYSNVPSLIGSIFSQLTDESGAPLIPLEAKDVSGVSYPVTVNLSKDTRFYDYKKTTTFDISGLISENISAIANSILDKDIRKITIDDIFPIKEILLKEGRRQNLIYSYTQDESTAEYINVPIAYYGGGLNLSKVTYDGYDHQDFLSEELNIDLLDNYLKLGSGNGSLTSMMKPLMIKTVTTVTGYTPFKFVLTSNNNDVLLQETFNQAPSISLLITHAKGEKQS